MEPGKVGVPESTTLEDGSQQVTTPISKTHTRLMAHAMQALEREEAECIKLAKGTQARFDAAKGAHRDELTYVLGELGVEPPPGAAVRADLSESQIVWVVPAEPTPPAAPSPAGPDLKVSDLKVLPPLPAKVTAEAVAETLEDLDIVDAPERNSIGDLNDE